MNAFLGFVAGFLASGALIFGLAAHAQPHCPQEDSCQVDYRDGAWHVTEVQP